MTDAEWDKIRKTVRELWPEWMPAEAQRREFEHRLKHRQADTVERAVRDHFALDESFKTPTLARIIIRCEAVAQDKAPRSTLTAEARIAQREADRDDAIALEEIRSWKPDRLQDAISVAVAAGCIQDIARHDPEAWSRHDRGFIAAADWIIRTQPGRAQRIVDAAGVKR